MEKRLYYTDRARFSSKLQVLVLHHLRKMQTEALACPSKVNYYESSCLFVVIIDIIIMPMAVLS